MIFVNSATEPGQPWVMTSGNGFGPVPRHVDEVDAQVADAGLNCGNAFSAASAARQS